MTNYQIILNESMRLMQEGKLSGTGRFISVSDADGNERQTEIPEQIHTFSAWKKAGYIVRKGEHAIACFPVWKYREARRNDDGDGDDSDGEQEASKKMYLCKAFWFKASQVDKITA